LQAWETSKYIRTGAETQHLRVVGVINEFWLYANDELLAYVRDEAGPFYEGGLGMHVTNSGGEGTVSYTFDNLRVYVPGESSDSE
jgi:hypothetical protein